MKTIEEQGYTFQEWLSPEQIAKDVQQVADRISEDYKGKLLSLPRIYSERLKASTAT